MTELPRFHRLSNGFEVLVLPNRAAPVVAMDLWIRAGSACEEPGQGGLAHLVEHMLFKGTERRGPGAIAAEVEGVGGEINAFTSFDHTVYTLVLASRFTELGLDILADAVFRSRFDSEELEREKRVVLEEIKRGRDHPQLRLSRLLFQEAYRVHPYGRPVIGTEQTVRSFGPDHCRAFVARWYRPANMTLVVAGDVDEGALLVWVERWFGGGRRGRPRPPARPREPRPDGLRVRFEDRELTEVYLSAAFPGPSARARDVAAVDLLAAVLGQGEASRLQHRVKLERNLVRVVGAGAYTPRDPGLVYLSAVADPERVAEAFEAVLHETFRLRHEPVGARELDRARLNLEAEFVYQRETVQGQAEKAGFFHLVLGDAAAEQAYLEQLRAVGPAEVQAAARRYLRPERAVVVALGPSGVPGWDGAAAARIVRGAAEASRRIHRRSTAVRRQWVCHTLANGARVIVKVNPQVPLVALRAGFLGGLRQEPASQAGAFHLLARSWTRGTASRNVFDIAHAVDALGGDVEGFSGRNSFGLRAEFLSRYLEDGLELVAEILTHPTFPEEEVAKAREDAVAGLRARRDNPSGFAFRRFEAALYGGHPFGRDVLGTEEALAGLTAADLRALYRAAVRPENLAVAVVGRVSPDRVIEFWERALEDLAPKGELPPSPGSPAPPAGAQVRREPSPFEQAHVVVGFLGARITDADRYALRVVDSILSGQGGRLFRRLRDERGLAYAVTSVCVEGLDPGYIAGYIATAPEHAEEARQGLLEEMARLAHTPPDPDELDRARRKLVGAFEIALQSNQVQATQMALDEVYGLGYRSLETFAQRVMAVDAEAVQRVAARYLRPEASVSVVLGGGG
ncbi:M16 family metallopeptidase [Deferrisoma camini]|uniref:M16 family metallopeptidase n=1 Tax=Deferrisoma camini TaxID=1035120 RepID=UPI0004A4524B|nr:pitrilysin family protein [Deferrisoma camini]